MLVTVELGQAYGRCAPVAPLHWLYMPLFVLRTSPVSFMPISWPQFSGIRISQFQRSQEFVMPLTAERY